MARFDGKMIEKLDDDRYNTRDLVEVRIPLALPYVTGRGEYERFDGEVEVRGIHYTYVKRKLEKDTLFLLCLPNTAKSQLYAERNRYVMHSNDIPAEKNSHNTGKKGVPSYEYDPQPSGPGTLAGSLGNGSVRYCPFTVMLMISPTDTEHQPPDWQA
jgi:hypothetical protein